MSVRDLSDPGTGTGRVRPPLQHGEAFVALALDHFFPRALVAGVQDLPVSVDLAVAVAVPTGSLNGEAILIVDEDILESPDSGGAGLSQGWR